MALKPRGWSTWAWAIGLLLAVFAIYAPAVRYEFQGYDDLDHVVRNPYLQPLTFDRIWYFWRYPFNPAPVAGVPITDVGLDPPYRVIYTPLSFTFHALVASFALDSHRPDEITSALMTVKPIWFHAVNILLHGINVVLLFLLLRRLLRSELAAGLGALLFAVHPVQVEPVCWVTGQNNLLSTAFGLSAMLLYFAPLRMRGDQHAEAPAETSLRSRASYYGSVFLFACAILSKPTVAVLPLFVLILDYAFFERNASRRWLAIIPWLELCVISAVINKSLQTYPMDDIAIALKNRPFVIGDAFLFYLKQVVWPAFLIPDYGRKPNVVMANPFVYLEWIVPATVVLVLWATRRAAQSESGRVMWKSAASGFAAFFLILLPTSGLITYYFHAYSTVADRYLYLPMVGIALAFAGFIAWVADVSRRTESMKGLLPAVGTLAAIALVSFAVKSSVQLPVWTSDATLWAHVLEYNPRSWVAWLNRGQATQRAGNDRQAIEEIMHARDMEPDNWLVRQSLAGALYTAKKWDQAAREYRASLKLNAYNSQANLRLGIIASRNGKLYAAAKFFNRGLEIAPNNALLLANFGITVCKLGHYVEGEEYLRKSMKWGFSPAAVNLYIGISQAQQGHMDEAMALFLRSLKLNPNFFETHYNIGLLLEKRGKLDEAAKSFQNVMTLQADYGPAYLELGRIYLKQGQKDLAELSLMDAVRLLPESKEAKRLLAQAKKK